MPRTQILDTELVADNAPEVLVQIVGANLYKFVPVTVSQESM
ncbi:Uncharacterised protein [Mycobacteroides abscessus subsp. abscessus]|nr:Uncharacterised protein [Mycobacteroides abscessus subsp. abscessus]SKU85466.1 Uncharacterised protein [Mycobacteroides abscessus subsp. abscessus]